MHSKKVFFRNDDLGWTTPEFKKMAALFAKHESKLCAAAIPMSCLDQFKPGALADYKFILEVHSHGLTHLDFEGQGKKAEFGPARNPKSAAVDLKRAYEITRDLFEDMFTPVFTPPWNRFSAALLPALSEAGFKAISVDGAPRFAEQKTVAELNVTIDLHTNKSGPPSRREILETIEAETKPVGIMLHHKHMKARDFDELDGLLSDLKASGVETVFFRELMP